MLSEEEKTFDWNKYICSVFLNERMWQNTQQDRCKCNSTNNALLQRTLWSTAKENIKPWIKKKNFYYKDKCSKSKKKTFHISFWQFVKCISMTAETLYVKNPHSSAPLSKLKQMPRMRITTHTANIKGRKRHSREDREELRNSKEMREQQKPCFNGLDWMQFCQQHRCTMKLKKMKTLWW